MSKSKATHLRRPVGCFDEQAACCWTCKSRTTHDHDAVTCKKCLGIIQAKGLVDRRLLPEVPTICGKTELYFCGYATHRWIGYCPSCGQDLGHGWGIGTDATKRAPVCQCFNNVRITVRPEIADFVAYTNDWFPSIEGERVQEAKRTILTLLSGNQLRLQDIADELGLGNEVVTALVADLNFDRPSLLVIASPDWQQTIHRQRRSELHRYTTRNSIALSHGLHLDQWIIMEREFHDAQLPPLLVETSELAVA